MKVRIFYKASDNIINEWLEKKSDIEIKYIQQSQSSFTQGVNAYTIITISIFYEEQNK